MAERTPPTSQNDLASGNNHYSPEAVQAILSRALEFQSAETYSPQQLQEMAVELNIDPQVLAVAEHDWRSHQAILEKQALKQQKRKRHQRQQWLQYGFGSVLLIGINIATAGTVTWAVFPVIGWGLGVCFDQCNPSSKRETAT